MEKEIEVLYGELARRAQEQAKALEEPFRSIAFQTVLEDLIAQARHRDPVVRTLVREPAAPSRSAPKADPAELFLTSVVEAAVYSDLFASRGRLGDKSLAVLEVAKSQIMVDGLTAAQIARILIHKFRVSGVQAGHVARDLGKAAGYVQVVGTGGEKRFLLMLPGERRLEEIRRSAQTGPLRTSRPAPTSPDENG
jgi:hypothetical protein